jgi:hypothetical protein
MTYVVLNEVPTILVCFSTLRLSSMFPFFRRKASPRQDLQQVSTVSSTYFFSTSSEVSRTVSNSACQRCSPLSSETVAPKILPGRIKDFNHSLSHSDPCLLPSRPTLTLKRGEVFLLQPIPPQPFLPRSLPALRKRRTVNNTLC